MITIRTRRILLPPSARDVLSEGHLCFFSAVGGGEAGFESFPRGVHTESKGGPAYAPHSRRFGVSLFGGRGGTGSLDAERIPASARQGVERLVHASGGIFASRNRLDTEQALRDARAQMRREIRRWQRQCDADDPNEGAGNEVGSEVLDRLEQQLAEIPARLELLRKSGLKKISRSDPDSRFLRERGGFMLGYTATLAVSEDHLIVGQRVTQETNDNGLLLPKLDLLEQQCGEKVQQASADSGFFSIANLQALENATSMATFRTRIWRVG